MKHRNIILFLLLVILFGFGVLPRYKTFQKNNTDIKRLEIQKQGNITLLETLEQKKEENKKQEKEFLASIPQNTNQEDIIKDILLITQKSQFTFQQIRFNKSAIEKDGYHVITASLSVEGDINNTKTLLQLIEQNERFLSLEDISIQKKPKVGPNTVLLQLDISAFSLS